MKFGIAVLVALVFCLSPSVYGAESDVVRVFDHKLRVTEEEMEEYLEKADLERHGFIKTIENSTTTDEFGRKRRKTTIYYKVTCDCSEVERWERILEQRLPKKLKRLDIFKTTVNEVKSRITGRKTESCTVGLEIHLGRCLKKSQKEKVGKRAAAKRCGWWSKCCGCTVCNSASIVYSD
ncbi:uncharacterized protein LOC114520183 [Dendronephthya gigantea]|uniref:uncharacterized protein LOC114520183 n=1 Tax=Dendronephthya gigantea TaxID=151771 RepID=UPI00106C495A|nr:uncharacterized protein LOC114520183 [Dendronephthya gigantea]